MNPRVNITPTDLRNLDKNDALQFRDDITNIIRNAKQETPTDVNTDMNVGTGSSMTTTTTSSTTTLPMYDETNPYLLP
jgi:hypothetical protein